MSNSNAKRDANLPNFPFLDNLDIDQNVKMKLSINLASVYTGNSEVLLSPMAREHGAERILAEWNKVFQANRDSLNYTLSELEESQFSRCGPRSISKPWLERREGTALYFEESNIDYERLVALPDASRDRGKLRPISLTSAAKFLKNSTNSGLPFYTKKGLVKERVLSRFDYYFKRKDPCVLFTRTQEQGKTRDVWGYPIVDTLNEMRFYRPLLDYQKRLHWRSSLKGPENVNRKLTNIINKAMSDGLELLSIDFSSYDRSLKPGLQRKIFDYYKYLFQSKYSNDLDNICERKSSIGLVTPDGVIEGYHGEPSGSTLTNEDDSIAQRIIARQSNVLFGDLFDIQGDDGVYAIQPDKVNSLFNSFREYGIEVNESKSYRSNDYLIYLQNLYHNDYRKNGEVKGIYPTFRALNRLLYQERWSNFEDYGILGRDYYSIRALSILENCKYHPLFEKLVRTVLKFDKYKLHVSNKGIADYVKMVSESQGTEGILNNQYGDDVKGIKSFSSYKLVRSIKA